jgi:glycosyltransferase involved in cell wall biosynthesis
VRIGIVTSSYPVSSKDTVNAGVFVRDLGHELVNLGHEVYVITPRKWGNIETDPKVEVYYFPWLGGEKDLASSSAKNVLTMTRYATLVLGGVYFVTRYVKKNNLQVLLSMWAIPSGLFALVTKKILGVPYGVWALGSDIWARDEYPFGDYLVRRVLRKASFRFADGIDLAAETANLTESSCEFVPSVRNLSSDEFGRVDLDPDMPQFLYIGRYEYNKGPDLLVDAMCSLLDSGFVATLHMFGIGSMKSSLIKRVSGYEDYIHLNSYAPPDIVVSYMKACDWLVIPSRIESIPLVFMDALNMNIPVIVSDVGDIGELVRKYQIGRVVPSADRDALQDALLRASQKNKECFDSSLKKLARRFSLRESTVRCVEALDKAIHQG